MNGDVSKAVGRAMLAMRRSKGITQAEMGRALGTSQVTVSRWEQGARSPGVDEVASYAYVCESTPEALLKMALPTKAAQEKAVPADIRKRARQLGRDINSRRFGG